MDIPYIAVADADEIPVGRYKCLDVGGTKILLSHLSDGFHAVENRCSHANSPFNGPILKGKQIACPVHGARFDLRTGAALSAPAFLDIPAYPARVVNGRVELAVPPKA